MELGQELYTTSEAWGDDYMFLISTWNCSYVLSNNERLHAMCMTSLRNWTANSFLSKIPMLDTALTCEWKLMREPSVSNKETVIFTLNNEENNVNAFLLTESNTGNSIHKRINALQPIVYAPNEVRDLVFGIAAKKNDRTLKYEEMELFVSSLRLTGSRAEIVFFIDECWIGEFGKMADKYGGIRLISFNSAKISEKYGAVVIYRFILFENYLRTIEKSLYRYCLQVDTFDVYFQHNPFSHVGIIDGIAVYMENSEIDIGKCRYHRSWFNHCQAAELLSAFHSFPRICMGVLIALADDFINFLRLFIPKLLNPFHCNDQGLFNILIWSGELAKHMTVSIFSNLDGPVLHANTDWTYNMTAADGFIRNTKGTPFAVVHQYDRLAAVNKFGLRITGHGVDHRKKSLQNMFFRGAQSNWTQLGSYGIPLCATINNRRINNTWQDITNIFLNENGGELVCVPDEKMRRWGVFFCPSRSKLLPINADFRFVQLR